MKKFLIVISCLLVFCSIVVLCYFFGYPKKNIEMQLGKYYLSEKVVTTETKLIEETEYENSELYIEVYEDNKLKSFSGELGIIQSEIIYNFELFGTGLKIKDEDKVKYTGYYVNDTICITFEKVKDVEGNEIIVYTRYVYVLR